MALTAYERVKRWREKHRALYNLKRRKLPVPVLAEPTASDEGEKTNPANVSGEVRESTQTKAPVNTGGSQVETQGDSRGGQPSPFRLVTSESLGIAPVEKEDEPPPKGGYRDKFGNKLNREEWEKWQEMQRKAKEGRYEIDEQSQL